jgi:2-dehydro-3-deoxygalactonokinase
VVIFAGNFLAVDWGTTNRRIYLIEGGRTVRSERDDRGVTAIEPGGFETEVAAIRRTFGDLPMLLAGMIGSNIGWRQAPYATAPAGITELVRDMLWMDDRTAIVPGIATADDVMRGEEVQFLGAVEAGLVPPDALLCQPGTHCKWAEMEAGRVARFTTAITGELFALLRSRGLLSAQLGGEVASGDAFRAGIEEGGHRDVAASLFKIRAAKLLGLRDDADAASFASGVLIGADAAARLADRRYDTVHILADPQLAGLYAIAIEAQGATAMIVDSHAAFEAGITAIAAAIA